MSLINFKMECRTLKNIKKGIGIIRKTIKEFQKVTKTKINKSLSSTIQIKKHCGVSKLIQLM